MQVSRSKKWESKVAFDEQGNPLLTAKGKKVLRTSYSVLQDDFFNYMKAAGYTDVERGERGSTEEHLTVTQFKVAQEKQRLEAVTARADQAEHALTDTQSAVEKQASRCPIPWPSTLRAAVPAEGLGSPSRFQACHHHLFQDCPGLSFPCRRLRPALSALPLRIF